MITDNKNRLESFEKMLVAVKQEYEAADRKMKLLKTEGKEKTVTYRQIMGSKLYYQNMLSLYKTYHLTD